MDDTPRMGEIHGEADTAECPEELSIRMSLENRFIASALAQENLLQRHPFDPAHREVLGTIGGGGEIVDGQDRRVLERSCPQARVERVADGVVVVRALDPHTGMVSNDQPRCGDENRVARRLRFLRVWCGNGRGE